jgi:hypothetical protein
MKTKESLEVEFTEPPRIASRTDALELLDILLKADFVRNDFYALQALKDAIEREIIQPLRGRAPGVARPSPFLETSGAAGFRLLSNPYRQNPARR